MGIIRDWAAATGGQQGIPAKTGRTLRTVLGQMYQEALAETCGNHGDAEIKLVESIDLDRRFDPYQTDRLVSRFRDCYQNGSFLDFEDPCSERRSPTSGRFDRALSQAGVASVIQTMAVDGVGKLTGNGRCRTLPED